MVLRIIKNHMPLQSKVSGQPWPLNQNVHPINPNLSIYLFNRPYAFPFEGIGELGRSYIQMVICLQFEGLGELMS